jgi:hypothetical protein
MVSVAASVLLELSLVHARGTVLLGTCPECEAASYSPQVEDAIVSTGRVDAVSVNAPTSVSTCPQLEAASVNTCPQVGCE